MPTKPRQTLTEMRRDRVATLERVVAERLDELALSDTASRREALRGAEYRLLVARDDLAALMPDVAAPDVDAIRAAEQATDAARKAEARVKREALAQLLADVTRSVGGGPLPGVWERVRALAENASRWGSALDIRVEEDPLADAVSAALSEREGDGPPRIVITVPHRPQWTDCGALRHGVVSARRVGDDLRISYTSESEFAPMDGDAAIRQAVERALSLWIETPSVGAWSCAEGALEAVQTVAVLDTQPTHRITFRPAGGEARVTLVHLTDEGAAYDREEWEAENPADWERHADGVWRCQGQVTPGGANGTVTVEALSPRA